MDMDAFGTILYALMVAAAFVVFFVVAKIIEAQKAPLYRHIDYLKAALKESSEEKWEEYLDWLEFIDHEEKR